MLSGCGSGVRLTPTTGIVRHLPMCYKMSASEKSRKNRMLQSSYPQATRLPDLCYKIPALRNILFL